jgi:hypothetical protein
MRRSSCAEVNSRFKVKSAFQAALGAELLLLREFLSGNWENFKCKQPPIVQTYGMMVNLTPTQEAEVREKVSHLKE